MTDDLKRLKEKLIEILSAQSGYFGWVRMWWQGPKKYTYIGFELSEDISPTLENLTDEQRKKLVRIIHYFEIHAHPLKDILDANEEDGMYQWYASIAWSHFMTIVMFGMLEYAVMGTQWAQLDRHGHLINKGKGIRNFLESNLSAEIKADIVKRYSVENGPKYEHLASFQEVVDHLWEQIRSGFVHEAGIESKGLEWHNLSGMGTKENPIVFVPDVPMPEWLQITWQAILNSLGYQGVLKHPPFQK